MPLGRFLRTTLAPRSASDAALLARFAADRDEGSFAALIARHGPAVFGVCRRMLGRHHDAEDAVQAVFIVLARNATAIRRRDSLAAWLHGVAVRVCRKAIAKRRSDTPLGAEPVVIPSPTWENGLRAIDEALSTLPESLRQPLVLCYLNGLTRDEAAADLGLGEATLRGRLDRGKARLRIELERRGFPLAVGLIGTALTTNPLSAAVFQTTLDVALGSVPLPASVAPLTTGVLSMPPLKTWLTGIFAVTLVAAGGWLYFQPTAQADPFTQLAKPDPKAGKVEAKLAGVWAATQEADGGKTRRDTRIQFVDGQHLVWEATVTQSNLPAPMVITLRMKYQVTKEGELKAEVLEKWAGEDKLAKLSEADQKPRVYSMAWDKGGKSFTLKAVPASDSPWATMVFTRAEEKAKAADPLVPDSLAKIDRNILKRPKFTSDQPGYLLLAFGPDAGFKVWVVLDGETLFVDANGNGDLTDDEPVRFNPAQSTPPKAYVFEAKGVGAAKEEKKWTLGVSTLAVGASQPAAILTAVRDGSPPQKVGPTDFRFTDTPDAARVVHFGSKVLAVRPSLTMPSVLEVGKAADFRVQVGTPGVGAGSFASVGNDGVPKNSNPMAEFTLPPAKPGEKPVVLKVELKERCCGDQFFAAVEVPKDMPAARVKVTVRFPNCPLGTVAAFDGEVPVEPGK